MNYQTVRLTFEKTVRPNDDTQKKKSLTYDHCRICRFGTYTVSTTKRSRVRYYLQQLPQRQKKNTSLPYCFRIRGKTRLTRHANYTIAVWNSSTAVGAVISKSKRIYFKFNRRPPKSNAEWFATLCTVSGSNNNNNSK